MNAKVVAPEIKALVTLESGETVTAIALNPGGWFGQTHVHQIAIANALNPFIVVEAGSEHDAIDTWADYEKWGYLINDGETDPDSEDVPRAGNDSHPVNLDNVAWVKASRIEYVLKWSPTFDQFAVYAEEAATKMKNDLE